MDEVDIRYTRLLDIPYLKKWVSASGFLEALPMDDQEETDLFLRYLSSFIPHQSSLTATINHIPCGIATLFLMPYKKVSHHCSFTIYVDPSKWRQGIGRSLLKNIIHLAKNYFRLEALHTEILGDSPLIPLLHEMGFKEFVRQENYVKKEGRYYPRICLILEFQSGDHS
jgi:putative acetyltransferase